MVLLEYKHVKYLGLIIGRDLKVDFHIIENVGKTLPPTVMVSTMRQNATRAFSIIYVERIKSPLNLKQP